MKKDNINMEDLKTIEFNYDNLDILKIVKYFIGVVINDIEYMNGNLSDFNRYDLGSNYIIKSDDLESLCSIRDTINDIIEYNKEVA